MGSVLVTGSAGTVGGPLITELVAAGEVVRAAARHPERLTVAGAEVVPFDFEAPEGWPHASDGVDRVFLMRPPAISKVRTIIRPFVRMMAERRVRQVVFLSVLGANPALPHWRVERGLIAAGLPHTILRPSFFAQNLVTAYRSEVRDRDRIRLPAGRGRTSFIDTRDVAAVASLALRHPVSYAGAHTLTGPEALDWSDVASMLSATLARPIKYEPIGFLRYRRELTVAGSPPDAARVQLMIQFVARLGLAAKVTSDVHRLLGRPATRMTQFIEDFAAAWRRP